MKKLLFIGLLILATKGWADTIVFDTTTYSTNGVNANPFTFQINIGNGSAAANKCFVLTCQTTGGSVVNVSTGNIGGTPLIFARRDAISVGSSAEIWYTTGPPTGLQTVSVTLTNGTGGDGTGNAICEGSDYTGIDQTNPIDVSTGTAILSATSVTATATLSFTTDMIVDSLRGTGGSVYTAANSQTTILNFHNTTQGGQDIAGYRGPLSSGGSTANGWTVSPASDMSYSWIALKANVTAAVVNTGTLTIQ